MADPKKLAPLQPETPNGTSPERNLAPFRSDVVRDADGSLRVAYDIKLPPGVGSLRAGVSLEGKPHIWSDNVPVVGHQWAPLRGEWVLVGFDAAGNPKTTNSPARLFGRASRDGGLAKLYAQNKVWGVGGFIPPHEVDIDYNTLIAIRPKLWDLSEPPVGMTYTRLKRNDGSAYIGLLAYDINGRIIAAAGRVDLLHHNDVSAPVAVYNATAGRIVNLIPNDPIGGLLQKIGLGFIDAGIESVIGRVGLNTTDLFAIGAFAAVLAGPLLIAGASSAVGAGGAVSTGGALGAVGTAGSKRAGEKVALHHVPERWRTGAAGVAPVLAPVIEAAVNAVAGDANMTLAKLQTMIQTEGVKALTNAPAALQGALDAGVMKYSGKLDKYGKRIVELDPQKAAAIARDIKQIHGLGLQKRVENVRRAGPLDLVTELKAARDAGLPPISAVNEYMSLARVGMAPITAPTLDRALRASGTTLEQLRQGIPVEQLTRERDSIIAQRIQAAPVQRGRLLVTTALRPGYGPCSVLRVQPIKYGPEKEPNGQPRYLTEWKCIEIPPAVAPAQAQVQLATAQSPVAQQAAAVTPAQVQLATAQAATAAAKPSPSPVPAATQRVLGIAPNPWPRRLGWGAALFAAGLSAREVWKRRSSGGA